MPYVQIYYLPLKLRKQETFLELLYFYRQDEYYFIFFWITFLCIWIFLFDKLRIVHFCHTICHFRWLYPFSQECCLRPNWKLTGIFHSTKNISVNFLDDHNLYKKNLFMNFWPIDLVFSQFSEPCQWAFSNHCPVPIN